MYAKIQANSESDKGLIQLKLDDRDYDCIESRFYLPDKNESKFNFHDDYYRRFGFDQFDIIKEEYSDDLMIFLGAKGHGTKKKYVLIPLKNSFEIIQCDDLIHYAKVKNQSVLDYPKILIESLKKRYGLDLAAMFGKNIIHEIMINNREPSVFFGIESDNLLPKYCFMHLYRLKNALMLLLVRAGQNEAALSKESLMKWMDFCINLPLRYNPSKDPIESSRSYIDYLHYVGELLYAHGDWLLDTVENKDAPFVSKKTGTIVQALIFFALASIESTPRESLCYKHIIENELGLSCDSSFNLETFCTKNPAGFIKLYSFLFEGKHFYSRAVSTLSQNKFTLIFYYRAVMLIRLASAYENTNNPVLADTTVQKAFRILSDYISSKSIGVKARDILLLNFDRLDIGIKMSLIEYYFEENVAQGKELLAKILFASNFNMKQLNKYNASFILLILKRCILDSDDEKIREMGINFLKDSEFRDSLFNFYGKDSKRLKDLINYIPLHPSFAILVAQILLEAVRRQSNNDHPGYFLNRLAKAIPSLSLYPDNSEICCLLYWCCKAERNCITQTNSGNLKLYKYLIDRQKPITYKPEYVDFDGNFSAIEYKHATEELTALINASALGHKETLLELPNSQDQLNEKTLGKLNNHTLNNLKQLIAKKLITIEADLKNQLDLYIFFDKAEHIATYYFSNCFRQQATLPYFKALKANDKLGAILGVHGKESFLHPFVDHTHTPLAAERKIRLFSTVLNLLPPYLRINIYNKLTYFLQRIIDLMSKYDNYSEPELIKSLTMIHELVKNNFLKEYQDLFWDERNRTKVTDLGKRTGNPATRKIIADLFDQGPWTHSSLTLFKQKKLTKRISFLSKRLNINEITEEQKQQIVKKGQRTLLEELAQHTKQTSLTMPDFIEAKEAVLESKSKKGISTTVDNSYLISCLSSEIGLLALGNGLINWQEARTYACNKTLEIFLSDPRLTLLRLFKAKELALLKPYVLQCIEGDYAFFAVAEQLIPFDRLTKMTEKEADFLIWAFSYYGIFALQHKLLSIEDIFILGKEEKIERVLSEPGIGALNDKLYTVNDFIKLNSSDDLKRVLMPDALKERRLTLSKEMSSAPVI